MKLFPAKCHERATLRKLSRQTGNSSLLPGGVFHGGAFHLIKNSENSGLVLNGKRFFGSPDWKITRKSGTAQKVVPFSRLERLNGNLCSIYRISRLYHQFHAFSGLLSGQSSLGSLVFPKNGGWSGSGFWNRFANKLQGYYECSACHVLATLGARGFSCAVSGVGLRPNKARTTREKPLVPRVRSSVRSWKFIAARMCLI